MVHREHGIEFRMMTPGKKGVRTVGAHDDHIIVFRVPDGGFDNVFFFIPDQSFIACMRVKSEYRDPWFIDPEILLQALVNELKFGKDLFTRDMFGHLCYRNMLRYQRDAET